MKQDNAGTIQLGLELDSKGFNRQMNGMQKMAKKAGLMLAAAFSVKAMVNFGKQCLELGSDLTEVQNVVDTVFPTMNKQIDKFAQNAAKTYGLSETMAKRYAGTFGAMADAFGFAEKESYAMATSLTGLAGDVASFYNITQDEAYTKLKSVFTGETESLKELGVVMTQNALDQYALANGYGKTTSAMTEQEKVALRYAFVQQQLSNAAGDFAKTSGSWANQVRYLTLQMESFKASIGQGLINILTPVIQWLNVLMSKLVTAANAFKKFTETLTGKKSQPITLKNTSEGLNAVASGANGANKALGRASKGVKKLKRELAGFDQITKLSEPSSAGSGGGSGGGGAGGGIGGAGEIESPIDSEEPRRVQSLLDKYPKLRKSVMHLKESFGGFVKVVCKGLKWAYKNILKPFGNWAIKKWMPAAIEHFATVFDLLSAALKALAPWWRILWDVIKPVIKLLGKFFLSQLKQTTKTFKVFAKVLEKYVMPVTKRMHDSWQRLKKLAKELPEAIKQIPQKIREWFSGKIEGVEEWFGGIKESFNNSLSKLTDNLPDLSNVGSAVSESIGEVKAKVVAWFSDKKEELKNKWDSLTEDIKEKYAEIKATLTAIKDKTFDTVMSAWDTIKSKTATLKAKAINSSSKTLSAIKKGWDSIKSKTATLTAKFKDSFTAGIKRAWNGIARSINGGISKINKIPGVKISKMPYLAQGGYVKKNTPQLAMIGDNRHQGEVVAPEKKLEEMALKAASMAGGGVTPELISILKEILTVLNALDLNVYLDGKQLKKRIVDLINSNTKATGVCEINV